MQIEVSKTVEVKLSKDKSFIYLDKMKNGSYRVCFTTDNRDVVRQLRDNEILVEKM
jgi:hypothetical protein